jgi:hypothetical protein
MFNFMNLLMRLKISSRNNAMYHTIPIQTSLLEHAKKWIASCHGNDLCQNKAIDGPFCPTRVLDVNANDSREIRLIETGECPGLDSVPYIALSHCWGGSIKTQLTEKNLEEMKHSISADKLPKNFQDAISITRRLGAQYLWIDSLCIIQDSHEDWVRESAKLGLLYANAICTISATASRNSSGGCFLSRDPFMSDCILRSKQEASIFVRSWIPEVASLEHLFEQKVELAPLSQRA